MKIYRSILTISDMHHPYSHPDTYKFLKALKSKYKFDKVVCIGDEVDMHSISFHDHDPDLASPGDELQKAIKALKPIYKLFPRVDIVESNHGSMVLRKAISHGLPRLVFKSYREVLDAPVGWVWRADVIIETPTGPVYFCHGKSSAPGRLASLYGMSVVQGHFHEKAQISYISTPEKLMFDAHTGCLVNNRSLAMAYNKINPRRPIISTLVILNGIPQIVPMLLNTRGRWVKNL